MHHSDNKIFTTLTWNKLEFNHHCILSPNILACTILICYSLAQTLTILLLLTAATQQNLSPITMNVDVSNHTNAAQLFAL